MDVKTAFLQFGAIVHISLKVDAEGLSRGVADIFFASHDSVQKSIAFYHGCVVDRNSTLSVVQKYIQFVAKPKKDANKQTEIRFVAQPVAPAEFKSKMVADKEQAKRAQPLYPSTQARLHPNHTLRQEPYKKQHITLTSHLANRLGYKSSVQRENEKEVGEISMQGNIQSRLGSKSNIDVSKRLGAKSNNDSLGSRLGVKSVDVASRLGSKIK